MALNRSITGTGSDLGRGALGDPATVVHAEQAFGVRLARSGREELTEPELSELAGGWAEESGLPARASRRELQRCARRLGVSEEQALHIAVKQLHEELFDLRGLDVAE
ncbi:MAG: hypothetical protein ACLFMS_03355 [Halorhodospira sp.]